MIIFLLTSRGRNFILKPSLLKELRLPCGTSKIPDRNAFSTPSRGSSRPSLAESWTTAGREPSAWSSSNRSLSPNCLSISTPAWNSYQGTVLDGWPGLPCRLPRLDFAAGDRSLHVSHRRSVRPERGARSPGLHSNRRTPSAAVSRSRRGSADLQARDRNAGQEARTGRFSSAARFHPPLQPHGDLRPHQADGGGHQAVLGPGQAP